jgi:hypothetical protein
MKSESPKSRPLWPIIMVVVIGIIAFGVVVAELSVKSTEISAARSPDGSGYALLLDVPRDAHRNHSARICLIRSATRPYNPTTCTSIAYLSAVPANVRHLGIRLVWRSSTELEIRYQEAGAAYLYYPTYTWSSTRVRTGRTYLQSLTPIHISLVRTGRFNSPPGP